MCMRQSLKNIIDELEVSINDFHRYKEETDLFIEEARRGKDWSKWDKDVFDKFFEKNCNIVAKLGKGQMTKAEKASVKEHWMELAPHLKVIADSQDVPLWNEYEEIREIIKKYSNRNLNVATNRMLAGLQPKLFCTECDINRINKLVDYLRRYTDVQFTDHDPSNWEKASFNLLSLFKSVTVNKEYWDLCYIPYRLLEECESRFGNLPKKWLAYANRDMFRHADALHEIGFICWTMYRTNFSIGDEVYLFMSDERRVRFKTKVVEDNFVRGDGKYRLDGGPENNLTYKLELVAESLNDGLKEEHLFAHGFNGGRSIQHPIWNNPKLFDYIMPFFLNGEIPDYDEIPNPDTVFEGARKEIVVNSYERSREARELCIAAHGCKCAVCGMEFEKVYGELGRGYIHVHHIVPISYIGMEYELDPVKDLIPVCPNCHAMIHRKEPPFTIEELNRVIQNELSKKC